MLFLDLLDLFGHGFQFPFDFVAVATARIVVIVMARDILKLRRANSPLGNPLRDTDTAPLDSAVVLDRMSPQGHCVHILLAIDAPLGVLNHILDGTFFCNHLRYGSDAQEVMRLEILLPFLPALRKESVLPCFRRRSAILLILL